MQIAFHGQAKAMNGEQTSSTAKAGCVENLAIFLTSRQSTRAPSWNHKIWNPKTKDKAPNKYYPYPIKQ